MGIDSETEFWAHCSNVQAWCENDYDTRLLHSNLSFPLLKKLTEVGDILAKKAFKEEIARRLESGYPPVIIFLIAENYIDFLDRESFLLSIFNEEDAFTILEIEKSLKIKLNAEYESFAFCNKNSFLFEDKKILGLKLFDLNVNSAFKYIIKLKHMFALLLNGCNLTKLPHSIKKLRNLINLDLLSNKLDFILMEIKMLPKLQEIYLCANNISDLESLVEITENLEHLNYLGLSNNKLNQDKLKQIELNDNYIIHV
jgi:Leucine-rich repeat (LRR) protein